MNRSSKPLRRRTSMPRGTSIMSGPIGLSPDTDKPLRSDPAKRLRRGGRIKPVSAKRAAANRVRSAMADRLWPDRREGTVMCGCGRPECNRRADDLHETLTRARSGGDITSPDIWIPLSRICHDEIQLGPEWAWRAGLLKHDGLCCRGQDVCERYAEGGAV